MTMRMKLSPELSCLEAQEKFWRGKLKEVSDHFEKEIRHLQQALEEATSENERLQNILNGPIYRPESCSVFVQTSMVMNEGNNCQHCGKILTENEFCRQIEKTDENDQQESYRFFDYESSPTLDDKISEQIENENDNQNRMNEVEKTITKLFHSEDSSDSQKIADKLIELYEKRSKFIPVVEYDEKENSRMIKDHTVMETDERLELSENNDVLLNETNHVFMTILKEEEIKHDKNDHNVFPTVHYIKKKVMKNFTKIRRTYADIKMKNSKFKSCMNTSNGNITPFEDQKIEKNLPINHSSLNDEDKQVTIDAKNSSDHPLISAMKKSKSTGNIVKKVAFLDDSPTTKTVSESNLLEVNDYRPTSLFETKSHLVGTVCVHCDKYAQPIPAPRSKKNIILANS